MIGYANEKDFDKIICLWHKVFGDNQDVIKKYLERFYQRVLLYRENDEVLGMMSLLPISVKSRMGYYVYAVATDEAHRGEGIASKMIEYAKNLCKKDEFLILVPAQTSLFEFYKRLGFYEISCITKNQNFEYSKDMAYLPMTEISPTEFLILRKEFFKDKSFFEWDIDVLNLMHDCFGTKFLKIADQKGFIACDVFENTVTVKEMCAEKKDYDILLASVRRYFGMNIYSYAFPEKTKIPSAMVFGAKFHKPYFNLALD